MRDVGALLPACALAAALAFPGPGRGKEPAPDLPYRELTGRAEGFKFVRAWRAYYWREDFTFLLRDDAGKILRVISREPTPWEDLRLGTTFTGRKVDWGRRPRVLVVGVQGVDRTPAEFPGLDLDPARTVTALIVRVDVGKGRGKPAWKDYYVNNWFHHWGAEADRKVLRHYANTDPHYTVYGFLGGTVAPFDREGQELVDRYRSDHGGIIFHGRVAKADTPLGYEVRVLHLMGRNKKTLRYEVFHGDPKGLTRLDRRPPKK
jgi:hypothetical protein